MASPVREAHTGEESASRGFLATVWSAVCAVVGGVAGLLPHVLHHAGFLAGAGLITGVGGSLFLGLLGLLLSTPMLVRLGHRFGTWRAPAIAIGVFLAAFFMSAFVLGPALNDDVASPAPGPAPSQSPTPSDHEAHHSG